MDISTKQDAHKVVETILGHQGRMVSGSKSLYHDYYPNHIVTFNCNLCTEDFGKVWYGDIDISSDLNELKAITKLLNRSIYILYEMDGRFENEDNPKLEKFVAKISPPDYEKEWDCKVEFKGFEYSPVVESYQKVDKLLRTYVFEKAREPITEMYQKKAEAKKKAAAKRKATAKKKVSKKKKPTKEV